MAALLPLALTTTEVQLLEEEDKLVYAKGLNLLHTGQIKII
jgi:hypothetical protein